MKESFIERDWFDNVPGQFFRVNISAAKNQPNLRPRHLVYLEILIVIVASLKLLLRWGDSYFNEFLNFALGIPTYCSILFTDFKTVFVFALGHFVPMVVNFYDLQCKCTRGRLKMAENPLSSGQMLILRCGM